MISFQCLVKVFFLSPLWMLSIASTILNVMNICCDWEQRSAIRSGPYLSLHGVSFLLLFHDQQQNLSFLEQKRCYSFLDTQS